MKVLMHVGNEQISDMDFNGKQYFFPPSEPVEVLDDQLAQTFIEHKKNLGLVEVSTLKTRSGIQYDINNAEKEARASLKAGRATMVNAYISSCQDRIQAGKPPLPPAPAIAKIIAEDGVDLAKEGINLSGAGFKVENQTADLIAKVNSLSAMVESISSQNAMLIEQNKLLQQQNDLLKPKEGKKG